MGQCLSNEQPLLPRTRSVMIVGRTTEETVLLFLGPLAATQREECLVNID